MSPPDPTSPSEIAGAVFPRLRKGVDPAAVTAFLRVVADEMTRLRDAERTLSNQVAELEERVRRAVALDEAVLTQVLGEEATRVLHTAREAAAAMRERADAEVSRQRDEWEHELAQRRSEIAALVDAEIEQAKETGRQMVEEARQYRERVLADVVRRRERAKEQIDLLTSHRDQVALAFEAARRSAVDVLDQLGPVPFDHEADDEPIGVAELAVDPSPVTAPEPAPEPQPTAAPEPAPAPYFEPELEPEPEPYFELEPEPEPYFELAPEPEPEVHHPPTRPNAPVIALFGSKAEPIPSSRSTPDVEPPPAAETEVASSRPVDDLFARLRASSPDLVAQRVGSPSPVVEPPPTEVESDELADEIADEPAEAVVGTNPFEDRDVALGPLVASVSRRLKRELADEQNAVLDAVRRGGVAAAEALLSSGQNYLDRSFAAIVDDLRTAALAGAQSVASPETDDARVRADLDGDLLDPVREWLRLEVVAPLRERLGTALKQAEGDVETFSTQCKHVFREWKTQRIDDHVDDLLCLAHSRGVMRGLTSGVPICWLLDPSGSGCPDAEDNALAGVVPAGDAFPTGHRHPPAHTGCRCLVAPVAG